MKAKFNIISMLMLLVAGFVFTACSDGDDFDWNKSGLFVSGTENNPVVKFSVEDTPSTYNITVQSTHKVESDVTITLAIDTSLVAKYNAENATNYYPIPLDAVVLENPVVTISAGSAISTTAIVKLVSTESFVEGRTYVIPVTISNVSGASEDVIGSSKTVYLRVSRVINFYAINANYNASSNFVFDEAIPLTTWTYEVKIYPTGLANRGPQRFMAMEQKDESKALLLRFNEANTANKLQCMSAAGTMQTNTEFANNTWYLLSFVFDGSTYSVYVNGVLDNSMSGSVPDGVINFQRYEMGMSWTGYRSSQFFSHRFCELRVWNRALSASEIAGGICGVSADSEGLQAYWKFNEGSGYKFADATGHGFDMDWSKSQREIREGGGLSSTADAANYIKWVKDDNNKCAQ